jgi:hypothetical protein
MKFLLQSLLGVLTILTPTLGQTRDLNTPAQGFVCLDIVEKLASNSRNGPKVLVSQCCGGLKLFATLKVQGSGKNKKMLASSWRAEDAAGKSLAIQKPTSRVRTVFLEGRKENIRETLIVIESQKLCFVVAKVRDALN